MAQGLRVWNCHCSGSGDCSGVGSTPGLGSFMCHRGSQKKRKKEKRERKKKKQLVLELLDWESVGLENYWNPHNWEGDRKIGDVVRQWVTIV